MRWDIAVDAAAYYARPAAALIIVGILVVAAVRRWGW